MVLSWRMSKETDLFSSVHRHLQSHAGLPAYPMEEVPTPHPNASTYNLPLVPHPETTDTNSVYHLQQAHDGVYETGVVVAPKHAQSVPYNHAPYLNSSGADSTFEWDRSDTEIPLTKHDHSMGFAENEEDEAMQHAAGYPPDSRRHSLLSNWVGSSEGHGATSHRIPPRPSRAPWTNSDVLARQIDRRKRGIGRQKYPVVSWFLAYVSKLTQPRPCWCLYCRADRGQAANRPGHPDAPPAPTDDWSESRVPYFVRGAVRALYADDSEPSHDEQDSVLGVHDFGGRFVYR